MRRVQPTLTGDTPAVTWPALRTGRQLELFGADLVTGPAEAEREYLRTCLEFAPTDPGALAANLRGWWTPEGWYLCARCAGRLLARGCHLPQGTSPLWADRPEPFGVCVICE